MPPTDNIPPFWQAIVLDAIAQTQERRIQMEADGKLMTPKQLTKAVYDEVVKKAKASGIPEEEWPLNLQLRVSGGMTQVVNWCLKVAKEYPPTHRKGYGDASIKVISTPPPIFFLRGGGGSGGPPPGPGEGPWPEPETPEEYDDFFEWVPDEEQDRARAMLYTVRDETGFGYFDNAREFCRTVAQRLGGRWGLNGKRGNPNDISTDILAWDFPGYQPQLFDVVIDSGVRNEITWRALPYPQSAGAVWIAP